MVIMTVPLRNYTILLTDASVCILETVNYANQFHIKRKKIMDVAIATHVSHDTF